MEDFDSALQIYSSFEMNADVDTNIAAVQSAKLACTGQSDFQSQSTKTYSSLFNLACFQIAGEEYNLALDTLDNAKSIISPDS